MMRKSKQESEIIAQLARIEEGVDYLKNTLASHISADEKIFHGDGEKPGLLIEHDRLMSSAKTWRWIFGGALSAMSIALAERFIRG